MASLKEVKERIASVNGTLKITSAMKMVASAKLHKAQELIEGMWPYEQRLSRMLESFLNADPETDSLLTTPRPVKRAALVVFASNGSLCGGYNANVIRHFHEWVNNNMDLGKENLVIYPVGKKIEDVKIVTSGAGAAGIAIIRLLMAMGLKNVIMTDRKGAIYEGREGLNPIKEEMAKITNFNHEKGSLADVIRGADVFIGVSAPGTLTGDMVRTMADKPIIFACANPTPEIFPEEAKAAGAAVVSTGRSDYPNQVNNVLCFPGIFRGALDVQASDINDEMKIAAAYAIAGLVSDEELNADYILPAAFDPRVKDAVAKATAEAAVKSGVARIRTEEK